MIKTDRPLVTFALFSYNQEAFIRDAVVAALAQEYSPLEMIISDDCSSDRTYEIINEVANSYDGEIQIILNRNEINVGLIKSINKIMTLTNGEFIVMAAGDDISLTERTSVLMNKWLQCGSTACSIFTNATMIDAHGNNMGMYYTNPNVTKNVDDFIELKTCWVGGFSHGFSRKLYDKYGPITEETFQEDGAISFRAILNDGIYYLSQPTVYYRRHSDNSYDPSDYRKLKKLYVSEIGLAKGQIRDLDGHIGLTQMQRSGIKMILANKISKNYLVVKIPGFLGALFLVKSTAKYIKSLVNFS